MIDRHASAIIVLLATLSTAPPAMGQTATQPPDRHVFRVSAGLSAASAYSEGDLGYVFQSQYRNGLGWYFAAGLSIGPDWGLGIESDGYTKSSQGATERLSFYALSASVYSPSINDLWLKGELGYLVETGSGGGYHSSQGGFGAGIAVGYDFSPGHGHVAIIPYLMYVTQLVGGKFEGSPEQTWKATMFQIGIGVGYHD